MWDYLFHFFIFYEVCYIVAGADKLFSSSYAEGL